MLENLKLALEQLEDLEAEVKLQTVQEELAQINWNLYVDGPLYQQQAEAYVNKATDTNQDLEALLLQIDNLVLIADPDPDPDPDPNDLPTHIHTMMDSVPVFGRNHHYKSIMSGDWQNPTTWNNGLHGSNSHLFVDEGHTVILSDNVDCGRILVAGKLVVNSGSKIKCKTIMVLPQGELILGDKNAAIFADIIFKDSALDTVIDPYRFDVGLLVFGKCQMYGHEKTPFVKCHAANAGVSDIELFNTPLGWSIGDELVITDTRQVSSTNQLKYIGWNSRWLHHVEEHTLNSIDGTTLALDVALQYSHLEYLNPHDTRRLTPHLMNLTRSINITSENPDGVRGHVMFFDKAVVDVNWVRCDEMGRTRNNAVTDSTVELADGSLHIGTNQIARYAWHFHHHIGSTDPSIRSRHMNGCVSSKALKWGYTIHGSHYLQFTNNISYDCWGSGVTLEGGEESYNLIEGCMFCLSKASGSSISKQVNARGVGFIDISRNGSGIWCRGCHNYIQNNIVNACQGQGIDYNGYYRSAYVDIPTFPGQNHMHYETVSNPPILSCQNNEIYGYVTVGIWRTWPQGGIGSGGTRRGMDSYQTSVINDNLIWNFARNGFEFWHDAKWVCENNVTISDWEVTKSNYTNAMAHSGRYDLLGRFDTVGYSFDHKYTNNEGKTLNCYSYNSRFSMGLANNTGQSAEGWNPSIVDGGHYAGMINFFLFPSHGSETNAVIKGNVSMGHPDMSGIDIPRELDITNNGELQYKYIKSAINQKVSLIVEDYNGKNYEIYHHSQHPDWIWGPARGAEHLEGLTNTETKAQFNQTYRDKIAPCVTEVDGINGFACEI